MLFKFNMILKHVYYGAGINFLQSNRQLFYVSHITTYNAHAILFLTACICGFLCYLKHRFLNENAVTFYKQAYHVKCLVTELICMYKRTDYSCLHVAFTALVHGHSWFCMEIRCLYKYGINKLFDLFAMCGCKNFKYLWYICEVLANMTVWKVLLMELKR